MGANKMGHLTVREIYNNYKTKKEKAGWKRTQIWHPDGNSDEVKARIIIASKIHSTHDDNKFLEELTEYNSNQLRQIP